MRRNESFHYDYEFIVQDGYIYLRLKNFANATSTGLFITQDKIYCTKDDIKFMVDEEEKLLHYGELTSEVVMVDDDVYVNKLLLEYLYNMNITYNKDKVKAFCFDGRYGYTEFYEIFSDYANNIDYEIKSQRKDHRLYLTSTNKAHSNIFMGYYTKLSGLKPNACYEFKVAFTLGTNAKKEEYEIMKNQAENVFVKCGLVNDFPGTYYDEKAGLYRLDIDMGIDSFGGTDLHVVSDMTRLNLDEDYGTKRIHAKLGEITNDNGEVYLIIGTDSDYDGETEFFLENVEIQIAYADFDEESKNLIDRFLVTRPIRVLNENHLEAKEVFFYPNSILVNNKEDNDSIEFRRISYHTDFINDFEFSMETGITFSDLNYTKDKIKRTVINNKDMNISLFHINDDVIYLKDEHDIYELVRNNYYCKGL